MVNPSATSVCKGNSSGNPRGHGSMDVLKHLVTVIGNVLALGLALGFVLAVLVVICIVLLMLNIH
jgi:hypothetical protein